MEELDLKEIFKMFWKEKVLIIIAVILFMEIGVIYTLKFVEPVYTSTTTLVLATNNEKRILEDATITTTDITINSKLVSTYSEIIKSKNILRQVTKNLHMKIDEDALRKNIAVNSKKNTEIIEISVTDKDKYIAKQVANEIARVFIDAIKQIYNTQNVQIVDVAEIAENPSNINHTRDIVMFAAFGFFLAIAYVFLKNFLDTTIKSSEEIENSFNLHVLATIPMDKEKGGKKDE